VSLDDTHDPERRSWVETANDPEADFPLQNLPLGCARVPDGSLTVAVAIGELILDAGRAAAAGLLDGTAADVVMEQGRLNQRRASTVEVSGNPVRRPAGQLLRPNGEPEVARFATTISPWIVTPDALKPFRAPAMSRADGDPRPLPCLDDAEATLPLRSDARHLYWTPAQMLTHHISNGCSLQPGDLLGTGTISGPELGSLLELTEDARRPVVLPNGETRGYLQDGDEVSLAGRCVRDGFVSIGLGRCTATVTPAA
jgi:2-keto-4-pentenoate hydratase/2-oxohepta-3-ene-1,7-dioic acid hydratase in catechol pathway